MGAVGPAGLGLLLAALGAGLWLLALGLLRLAPRLQPATPGGPRPPAPVVLPENGAAVVVIQPGGRVAYLNPLAREWFNLADQEPGLERLARRVRPGEAFLSLCAEEGAARLALNGRSLEGVSYCLPGTDGSQMLVALRRPQAALEEEDPAGRSLPAAGVAPPARITELNQALAASLDLPTTIQVLLEGVERILPADLIELTLWEAEAGASEAGGGQLVPYRLAGLPGADRRLERGAERYQPGQGYSGRLVACPGPLLVADVDAYREARLAVDRQRYPILSYLGIALATGGELIGTLELASLSRNSFDESDAGLLQLLSGQAAAALRNARRYSLEQQRSRELAGLARLAQAAGGLNNPQELFAHLVEGIAPLLDVEILGFLIFDENRRILAGQVPFLGIQENALGWYQAPVPPDSPAENLWGSLEMIVANEAAGDARLEVLGLSHMATAAGIRRTVLAPLISGGRALGYLQAGNKRDGSPFDGDDRRLLAIIAGQAAPLIENAALIQQSRRRAQRAEALRRIASLATSNATLDEILKYALIDLARLLQADLATFYLLEDGSDELRLHRGSSFNLPEEQAARFERLLLPRSFNQANGTAPDAVFLGGRLEEDQELDPAYRPLVEALQLQSLLVAPLVAKERGLGVLLAGSFRAGFFLPGDGLSAAAIASQLAGAIEQAVLARQTDEGLRQRLDQMTALARIGRELNARLLDTSQALQGERPLAEMLDLIAAAIRAATPFEIVLISAYRPESRRLERLAGAGIPAAALAELQAHPQPWDGVQTLLQPEFRLGRAYFVPAERRPAPLAEIHTLTLLPAGDPPASAAAWQARDILVIPLYSASGQPLGLVSVDAPRNRLRPDRPAIETLEVFSSQAALALESHQKLAELRAEKAALAGRVKRAEMQARGGQNRVRDLQERGRKQVRALAALARQAGRQAAAAEIAAALHRQAGPEEVGRAFGQEILARLGFETVLVAETLPSGLRLRHALGALPPGANPEPLLGQRNPLWACVQSGQAVWAADVQAGSEWQDSPLVRDFNSRGFVCLPVRRENGEQMVIWASSSSPLDELSPADRRLFDLLAGQAGAALANLDRLERANRLLAEVSLLMEFSRRLDSLEAGTILQALAGSARLAAPAAQAVQVLLWEPGLSLLVPCLAQGYLHPEHLLEMRYQPGEALPGQAFLLGRPQRVEEMDFSRVYNLASENLQHWRDALGGRLPVSSLAVPIPGQAGQPPHGVLVLDQFELAGAFSAQDEKLVVSLAQQTGLVLENARLVEAAEQRAAQLQALTRVAGTISSSLETEALIPALLAQLAAVFPFDTGALWLRAGGPPLRSPGPGLEDEPAPAPRLGEQRLVLQAARGFADSEERIGLSVAVEDSVLFREMIETRRPVVVPDVLQDPRFPALMEYERRSWLGAPLMASGEVIGVIALEKNEPGYFSSEHVQLATTFASQAAVALENASLYQDSLRRTAGLDQRSHNLAVLNQLSVALSQSLEVEEILDLAVRQCYALVLCRSVSAVLVAGGGPGEVQATLAAEFPGGEGSLGQTLPPNPLFEHIRQTQGIFHSEEAAGEPDLEPMAGFLRERETRTLLAIPLAAGNSLHGLILFHSDQPQRFEPVEVELARTIGNQVAIAVQNARLYAETRRLSQTLELRVQERTAALEREHRRAETLLRTISELSGSLDLDQVLQRTLNALNEELKAEQVSVVIARPERAGLQRLAAIGYGGEAETPDREIGAWILANRRPVRIADLGRDPAWAEAARGSARSVLGAPLMSGAEALGALLLFHPQSDRFSQDQLDLVQAVANQAAIAVNNAGLFRLIRDQAEDLGAMLRRQQVETSRSRAILEAVADGVLVTGADRRITLFNASAEKILDLERGQVIGRSLEHFSGLFGRAAQAWMETIHTWSQDPAACQAGTIFSEELVLDTGRVISVHLAPVSLRGDFLGTVSIFQDISHQVEVDRLKSEFVAAVSHELRTPMTSIKGYAEILLMGAAGELTGQQKDFLQVIRTNTDRLAVLVSDLLDISRIEAGKVRLALQSLDLEEAAAGAVEGLRWRAGRDGKAMTIAAHAAGPIPPVLGDPERVRQVLDNLLDNAYQYTHPGGEIHVRLRPAGEEVQVDVQDTGMGIPPAEQSRVFERFYRGENPLILGVAGAGLGLAMVQNLVHMHNGRIWLESAGQPGAGSTFSFTLPVYRPPGLPEPE